MWMIRGVVFGVIISLVVNGALASAGNDLSSGSEQIHWLTAMVASGVAGIDIAMWMEAVKNTLEKLDNDDEV